MPCEDWSAVSVVCHVLRATLALTRMSVALLLNDLLSQPSCLLAHHSINSSLAESCIDVVSESALRPERDLSLWAETPAERDDQVGVEGRPGST